MPEVVEKVGCIVIGTFKQGNMVTRITIHQNPPAVFSAAVLRLCQQVMPNEALEAFELMRCAECERRGKVKARRVTINTNIN